MFREQKIQNANEQFRRAYPDIVADPRAFAFAQATAAEKLQARPNADPAEIAVETGQETREALRDADRAAAIEIMKRERGQFRKESNR